MDSPRDNVDLPGDRRSATGTYRRGSEVASFVAQTIPELHAKANRALGEGTECLSISTPRSIHNALSGYTRKRAARTGMHGHGSPGVVQ